MLASTGAGSDVHPSLLCSPIPSALDAHANRCYSTVRGISRDDNWTGFAPLAIHGATPSRAICLPSSPLQVRIPSHARSRFNSPLHQQQHPTHSCLAALTSTITILGSHRPEVRASQHAPSHSSIHVPKTHIWPIEIQSEGLPSGLRARNRPTPASMPFEIRVS